MQIFRKNNPNSIIIKIVFGLIIGIIVFINWMLIGQVNNKVGKILGFVFYFLVASYALFEYAKVLDFSTWVCFYFALLPLISFFNPWDLSNQWFISENETISLSKLILSQYSYEMFGIVGLGYLVQAILVLFPFLFFKKIFVKQNIIFYFISYVVVIILTITSKSLVFANVDSMWYLLVLFIGQITCDTFAYFGGMFFGNKLFTHKLAPKISPNKTIEGAIIGSITSWLILFLMFWFLDFKYLNVPKEILVGVVPIFLPIVAILGDLGFSWIKRLVKIKDFSNLLPGHGGILDRVDSTALVAFVFLTLFIVV